MKSAGPSDHSEQSETSMIVRDSCKADIAAITNIYAHWVLHSAASFEVDPPSVKEMASRRDALLDNGFPYLVAVDAQSRIVVGYAYAGPYRPRIGYRFSCENSIYISPFHQQRGIGRRLMCELISRSEKLGLRLMIAVIGDSRNEASIRLHQACSFERAGLLSAVGWKHGRWVDSILMARPLGEGCATMPG